MAEEDKDQKTEEASSKRVRESEERGQFANSREISSAFILLAGILSFSVAGPQSVQRLMGTWSILFREAHAHPVTVEGMNLLMMWLLKNLVLILAPILIIIMIAGVLANVLQTQGLKFSAHPLTPNFSKLNPLKGFGRIFSKNSLMELVKSLFKVGVVSMIVYLTIRGHFDRIPALMGFSVGQVLSFMGDVAVEIMSKVLLFMIILAVVDYVFQRFTYKQNIRMSKQEVKQERKETEGDPQVKQRIRQAQLQMARNRMMAAVPEADVVVTNPTHISIAIKYDNNRFAAPVVVAKGTGHLALKIREIAREHDVPLVEDKPLAQALNKSVEIGQYIPAALYKAVAEILAYVYKLKGKLPV